MSKAAFFEFQDRATEVPQLLGLWREMPEMCFAAMNIAALTGDGPFDISAGLKTKEVAAVMTFLKEPELVVMIGRAFLQLEAEGIVVREKKQFSN